MSGVLVAVDGASVVAIVPARSGSVRLSRKNMRSLGGQPLASWTLDAAQRSKWVDSCFVTTDCQDVADLAPQYGFEVIPRPMDLASAETTTAAVLQHALSKIPVHDIVVLLQVTSPLRTSDDIDAALELLVSSGADSVLSARRLEEPASIIRFEREGMLSTANHEASQVYALNGALYSGVCPRFG